MASGIPNHEVTRLGSLSHLPVVHRATRSDPVFRFGDVLGIAIHLKCVNFNQGAFQVQMPACRDAISPKGASDRGSPATNDCGDSSHCLFTEQPLAPAFLGPPHVEASR
jgi:hypothetical protein